MSLRGRLVLLAAGTVGVTVVLASIVCFAVVRDNLRDEVDKSLLRSVERVRDRPGAGAPPPAPQGDGRDGARDPFGGPPFGGRRPPPRGEPENPVQLVRPDGTVQSPSDVQPLPVSDTDRAIARGEGGDASRFEDRTIDGDHVRVLTAASPAGALVAGRSLEGVDSTLSRLRLVLAFLCAAGIAVAVVLTRVYGDRLQASRDALAASVTAQRQLVADASHELRTPVTSLRTNVEVLLEGGAALREDERRRLLDDVRDQSEELTLLINDVIELARGDEPLAARDDVRLDEVAGEAVARARRNAASVRFEADLSPVVVRGDAERLGRAVGNLLDNAAKHSPAGGVVDVAVRDGVVSVRDRGPGVPDADKPLIFDRFYRGATARGRPGSGLGLAIVRQVAVAHGGDVTVEDAPGGGALFRLRLPADAPGG